MSLLRLAKLLGRLSRWSDAELRQLEKLVRAPREKPAGGKPAEKKLPPDLAPPSAIPLPLPPPERLCQAEGAVFHPGSHVENLTGKPEALRIGAQTHLRGELLVFPYAENLRMGEWGYLGDRSRIWSGETVEIGDNVLISHDVFITGSNGHEMDARERAEGFRRLIREGHSSRKGNILTGPVIIGNDVWINPQSIILPGVSIGPGTVIGCGSVVTRSLPAGVLAAGNPARVIRELQPGGSL